MKVYRLNVLLAMFLFLICCFPYITFIDTSFDTQPYAIGYSLVLIFFLAVLSRDFGIPKLLFPYLFIFGYSLIYVLLAQSFSMGLRSIVGYASVLSIALASYTTFKFVKGRQFIFIVVVWFLFGIVQQVVSKDFGSFMLSRLSTSESRGITSLAAEPSYYAITCLFFFVLNDVFYTRKQYSKKTYIILFILLTIQMIFSRAGVGMMLFLVYLLAKLVAQQNTVRMVKQFVAIAILVVLIFVLFNTVDNLHTSRLGVLIDYAINNPKYLLYSDGSIADRLVHIILSHLSLFYSNGLGLGLGNWDQYSWVLANWSGGFPLELANVNMTAHGRIMSGWGTVIFELGIVGVFFFLSFAYIMYRGFKSSDKVGKGLYISSFLTIYFIVLNGVSISHPLFGYLIGVFIYIHIDNLRVKKYASTLSNIVQ